MADTAKITLNSLKSSDGWASLANELGIFHLTSQIFEYGEYADIEIEVDKNLNIVGGKILPFKKDIKLSEPFLRFRIEDPSGRSEKTRHTTIEEVVANLRTRDIMNQVYYVECLVDDIQIPSDELLTAWDAGERPEDLQFF